MSSLRTRVSHPVFARGFHLLSSVMEHGGLGEQRTALLEGLHGTVVEVGSGDGANLAHYPATVDRVIAVEPEDYLRHLTERTAAGVSTPRVEVRDAVAEELPVESGTADAVVFCMVLCSVSDPARAVSEAVRVLRSDGQVRVMEHVRAHEPGALRTLQRRLDATVWPRLFGGCHCHRDTVAVLQEAGFETSSLTRTSFPPGVPSPVGPHVVGTVRRAPQT